MAGQGRVVAVDLAAMEPISGVVELTLDLTDPDAPDRIRETLGGQKADVVLSDMHAPATGHKSTDHLRIMGLAEAALDLAEDILAPGGTFLCKVLQGGASRRAGRPAQPLLRQGSPCEAEGEPRRIRRDVCARHRVSRRRDRGMRHSRDFAFYCAAYCAVPHHAHC